MPRSTSAAGADTLTLSDSGANSATISNVETLIGGSANDTITLGAAASKASIDLGAGTDTLTFGKFANTATVSNVETIVGGSLADTLTLGNAFSASIKHRSRRRHRQAHARRLHQHRHRSRTSRA